jgi:hypothetical protein
MLRSRLRNISKGTREMNANELADELEMVRIELTIQAATMLRQQQAEIEALNQIIDANNKFLKLLVIKVAEVNL